MRDSFLLYTEIREVVEEMELEQKGMLFQAILDYVATDEMPEIEDHVVKIAFISVRQTLDKNNEKYEKMLQQRREASKKGVEARAKNNNRAVTERNRAVTEHNRAVTPGNRAVSDNDNVHENVNDNENVNDRDNGNENENEKEEQSLSFSVENDCRAEAQRVIEEWNTLDVAPVNTISKDSKRYKMLCSRIKEHGAEKVIEAIHKIRDSSFLLGRKTDFVITFDWFVKPNNFVKVADGNYTDNARSGTTAEGNRQAFYDKWRDV